MAGNWAYLRKHWIKPEVYPLIGSMVAALGVCSAAIINKISDPAVTWNKSKRGSGIEEQLEGVDEIVPMWSQAKNNSIRIFGTGNPIHLNKSQFTALPDPITVTVSADVEDDDEEEAVVEELMAEDVPPPADIVTEEPATEVLPVSDLLEVVDEAAETINAAVDAAIQSAAAVVPDAAEPATSSVTETLTSTLASEVDTSAIADIPPVSPKPAEG